MRHTIFSTPFFSNPFRSRLSLVGLVMLAWALETRAQVTYTDNFTSPINYLTNGVVATIWDGLYLGAGELANSTGLGSGAGTVSVADANISSISALTVASLQTDWENAADDGVFFFKVITGNFDMSVHVLGPIDTGAYNFPGLMVRVFGPGGSPLQPTTGAVAENSLLWARFDEYSNANMRKNNVNGVKTDTGLGTYPNTNYWLRVTRSGNLFTLYERANPALAWTNVGTVTRADFSGVPLQVGIEHAVFGGGATHAARYANFSLTVSNMGPFATAPGPATGLTLVTNASGNLTVSWNSGAGSSGSVVAVWTGTNRVVKQTPANGFTYAANAGYGVGATLPGANYFVVYNGAGNSATVNNLVPGQTYQVAVFSYAGSGSSIAYNRSPPIGSVAIPFNPLFAQASVLGADVSVTFKANPGEWYWLQYSDSLRPAYWQNVVPGPVLFTNVSMTLIHPGGASGPQRFYRLQQVDPLFTLRTSSGAVTSLQRTGDTFPTEYIAGGRRLGDVVLKYRQTSDTNWHTVQTASLSGVASASYLTSLDGTQYTGHYLITNSLAGTLVLDSVFTYQQGTFSWSVNTSNLTSQTVLIGDLALPLPMNMAFNGISTSAMKHSFISGYGSCLFWMRPNSVGPYLLMTPAENTKLEYWDDSSPPFGYQVYIHSYVAGTNALAKGTKWRQPNTSLTLPSNGSQSYGFKFQWVNDYDGVRQALVNEGKLDVHIIPGMTLPTNLFAQVGLRTTQTVASVTAEFPSQSQVQFLGTTNVSGSGQYQIYQVQFSRLGENELTIQYGNSRTMYLEFFVTEPIETLISKRATFLVSKQTLTNTWYNGLFAEWNMNDQVWVTPDNHDTISGFVVYEIASDDAGESRPAYMGAKEAVFPVQSEVTALDTYIAPFDWGNGIVGGLQRTTNETYSYGVYGTLDWHQNRTNNNLNLGRGYDYPHIVVMYYGMYQVAKFHPEVTTMLSAQEYLRRAYGTAVALFTVAGGGQAYQIGLMNEVVTPDVLDALQAEGMTNEAATLRGYWEQKVNYFATGNANLFGSEYSFDSTGFEAQEAFGKYALVHAGSDLAMGSTNAAAFLQHTWQFMSNQITANVFDRGWLETAYYHYGSDFRGDMGDDYVLSYMSQMGGWGLLDYALNFAANPTDYLRLGYASILSAWATMNTGTPDSNYGYWYPGAANDGGCGGGFEPLPFNTTWLGQPMHRGAWYYSCEENLGFCGALRAAATILNDDPIFGRICYGGLWQETANTNLVIPLDGVRRRFHALLGANTLHLILTADRFASAQPILLRDDFSLVSFQIESGNPNAHNEAVHITVPISGQYTLSNNHGVVGTFNLAAGQDTVVNLPVDASASGQPFSFNR